MNLKFLVPSIFSLARGLILTQSTFVFCSASAFCLLSSPCESRALPSAFLVRRSPLEHLEHHVTSLDILSDRFPKFANYIVNDNNETHVSSPRAYKDLPYNSVIVPLSRFHCISVSLEERSAN